MAAFPALRDPRHIEIPWMALNEVILGVLREGRR